MYRYNSERSPNLIYSATEGGSIPGS